MAVTFPSGICAKTFRTGDVVMEQICLIMTWMSSPFEVLSFSVLPRMYGIRRFGSVVFGTVDGVVELVKSSACRPSDINQGRMSRTDSPHRDVRLM